MQTITRQLGIDMGHRVVDHGSKCKNLHGHRYLIEATVTGELSGHGAERGMVMDFGFLKEEMLNEIDAPCDHGVCLWHEDPELAHALGAQYGGIRAEAELTDYCETTWRWGKLYVVNFTPTAENLAQHWFTRLAPRIIIRTNGRGSLVNVRVWETPNCYVDYSA